MADSVIVNKIRSIELSLMQVSKYYKGNESDFDTNFMRQDAILLNLQRACEFSLDLCNHLIKTRKLGVPQNSKQTFEILEQEKVISPELSKRMTNMVGFRNIAVHEYSKLDIQIVKSILENRLQDFRDFVKIALKYV